MPINSHKRKLTNISLIHKIVSTNIQILPSGYNNKCKTHSSLFNLPTQSVQNFDWYLRISTVQRFMYMEFSQTLNFHKHSKKKEEDIFISQLCEVMVNINKASQSVRHKFKCAPTLIPPPL